MCNGKYESRVKIFDYCYLRRHASFEARIKERHKLRRNSHGILADDYLEKPSR